MPKPKNPLPTLREKLASFDGAIGADDIARLLQTSRHTIYLWVRDDRIPHFRLNGSLKFDPALIADWIDSTSSIPKKAAPSEKMRPASSPSSRSKTAEQYAQLRPS
jgi:predicted DNA-binding transcriptional regulator AlpA